MDDQRRLVYIRLETAKSGQLDGLNWGRKILLSAPEMSIKL